MKFPQPLRALKTASKNLRARHAARHQASGFGFLLADSIDYIEATRWDELTAESSVWMRRDVLRVIEQQGPENVTPRYVLIFQNGQPVAALAAQIVHVTGQQLPTTEDVKPSKSLVKKLLKPAHKLATKKLKQRLLVAGNLLCWGFHGITLRSGEDPAGLWTGLGEALYRIRRAERLTGQTNLVMIKDFTAADRSDSGMDSLHRLSYRPLETEPDMVLQIPSAWSGYADYLAALESKYRSNVKAQQKKLAAGGIVIERLEDLGPVAARLHELYLAVQQNASLKLVSVPADYLPALAAALGADFRCHVARRGEEIVGFVTSVRDRTTAIAYYIGFDREAASSGLPIYLQLLHATIADAIHWKCTRLSLGRTALEPKAALGAKPEPLAIWMRHRVPALNWIIRSLLDTVPHDEPPERKPFKEVRE
jgi:Acetyltransferase (GNAT) domain